MQFSFSFPSPVVWVANVLEAAESDFDQKKKPDQKSMLQYFSFFIKGASFR